MDQGTRRQRPGTKGLPLPLCDWELRTVNCEGVMMQRERQTILSLVALGRITPREAERLLAAWNAGREEMWVVAACAVVGIAQSVPMLVGTVHALLPGGLQGLYHAVAAIPYWMGGVQ